MTIKCTLNDVPLDLGDSDIITRQLIMDATVASVVRRLYDIRDPVTGEPVRITFVPSDSGLEVRIGGSQAVVDEVNRRLSGSPMV
jgi:hypothetical protein